MDELKQKFIDVITKQLENPDIQVGDIRMLASAYESLDRNFAMKELVKCTSGNDYFAMKQTEPCVCLEEVKTNE